MSEVPFSRIAEMAQVTPQELRAIAAAYNDALAAQTQGAGLSVTALENMHDEDRISMRRSNTREWFEGFVKYLQGSGKITDEDAVALVKIAAEHSNSKRVRGEKPLRIDDDILKVAQFLQTHRDDNRSLQRVLDDLSGGWSILRKTTKSPKDLEEEGEPGPYYYKEPLWFGKGAAGATMHSNGRSSFSGMAYIGSGIVTVQLFAVHGFRTIATRTLMLFYDDRTNNDLIPGVLLRFSDDAVRPVASQVLAQREGGFDSMEAFLSEGLPGTDQSMHDPRKVRAGDPLFALCEHFDLESHAKAMNRKPFSKALTVFSDDTSAPAED